MARLNITELKPGMKLQRPVITRDGNMLIDGGAVLSGHLIDLLDLWGVPTVDIDEAVVPLAEPAIALEADRTDETLRQRSLKKEHVRDTGVWIKQEAKKLLNSVIEPRAGLDGERLRTVAGAIVDESVKTREIMASLTTILDYDTYIFAHSVHVSILSVIVGIAMGLEKKELYSLAYGGLLLDVGMMRIDQKIWQKNSPLSDEEFDLVKQHPVYGVQDAAAVIGDDTAALQIIRQHHERMDGSGYPNHIRGRLIHPLARIVAVCDVYQAMQADRAYRRKWLPYQVMSHLLVSSTETLDTDVVKAFLRAMSAYPIGSLVRLDNGEIGVVISSNTSSPIRPVVKVFISRGGKTMARPNFVDLMSDRRFIIGPVDPKEIGVEAFEVF